MSQHILLIDDDHRLAAMVSDYLGQSGYSVSHAGTGESGVKDVEIIKPDLVLLDLMLPGMDGLEVCKRVRSLMGGTSRTPIIMLTAKGEAMDRIIGLELGADDYLPKPFEPRELLARIKAVLRRQNADGERESTEALLQFGRLCIDKNARTVLLGSERRELTSYQFDLLLVLAERAGRVLTRDQIMELVRGRELEAFDRSIDVHMGRIRQAIEVDVKEPKRILTVRGVGYVFAKQQD
jgi:two-component system, OmpR family, phosphate regulon response regulator OmpR